MTNAYRSLRITIESKMRHGSRANAHTGLFQSSPIRYLAKGPREKIYIMISLCSYVWKQKGERFYRNARVNQSLYGSV